MSSVWFNGQTYVDVTFPTPPSGYAIEWNSVRTLEPMFTLTGPGVGNAKIDTSQAPAIVDQGLGKVRYWVIGSFVSGDVKATFVPGGPPFAQVGNLGTRFWRTKESHFGHVRIRQRQRKSIAKRLQRVDVELLLLMDRHSRFTGITHPITLFRLG